MTVEDIGTTPASAQPVIMLRSLCLQIFNLYGIEMNGIKPVRIKGVTQETIEKEEEVSKLAAFLQQELTLFPSSSRPLYLFIDSLDQLLDTCKFLWVPVKNENPHCRVILSLLADSFDNTGILFFFFYTIVFLTLF